MSSGVANLEDMLAKGESHPYTLPLFDYLAAMKAHSFPVSYVPFLHRWPKSNGALDPDLQNDDPK